MGKRKASLFSTFFFAAVALGHSREVTTLFLCVVLDISCGFNFAIEIRDGLVSCPASSEIP